VLFYKWLLMCRLFGWHGIGTRQALLKLLFVKKILFIICPLFLSLIVNAQAVTKLDSLFNALNSTHSFNGNVLVAENGHIVYSRSVGFSHLQPDIANTSNTAFQIGSVSKTITAVAVLQLFEKHLLHIDSPLVRYLPAFPYPAITIRHLLNHTSGLPDKEELFFPLLNLHPDTVFTNNDIIPAMRALHKPLAFTPGSQWRYCNTGFALLALVVQQVSGQPFGKYLAAHVFGPAGMAHAHLLGTVKAPEEATGYLVRAHYLGDMQTIDTSRKVRPWAFNMRWLEGPTNVVATAADLLMFDNALRSHKLLQPATVKKMLTPATLPDGSPIAANGEFGNAAYALGWFIQADTSAGKLVMHTGREPSFFSFFLRDLLHNRVYILLDNMESPGFGKACKQTFNIVSATTYFDEPQYKQSLFLPYARTLYQQGTDEATTLFNDLKTDTAHYFTDERELNELGLELLQDGHTAAGLEALKLCTLLYPGSWNTYDSYGKALLQTGKKQLAIKMYEKSLQMNPSNEPARQILQKLRP
jgi:CubicO group peptidase (beta-lactamase class C family)